MEKLMSAIFPVVSNSLRGGGKLTTLLLLISLLLISSCNGNGGAADSEGETYSPGSSGGSSGGSGGMTGSSSGGEMSAWDIMQMMDSGRGDEAVEILSGGGNADPVAEERGTFEVILPASSMNLPEGGWVELEIAGDAYFKGTAFPGPDGNVRFTVPRQRIGAIITVSLTAYLPEGTPYINGSKTGPAEEDGGASFAVPLEDLPAIIIGFGGDGAANGNTAEQGGDSYEVMEYSSGVSLNILSSIADATLEIKVNGADAAASQTLSDGFNDISVVATMGGGKPPVTASKKVYAVKKL
ncbi:MAG: hypothetical protein IJR93_02495, partial [Treponema sp.]|nr:hypothetical protein [Treponema sp.]